MNAVIAQRNDLFFSTLANVMVKDGWEVTPEELSNLGFRVILERGPDNKILYCIYDSEDYEISFHDLIVTRQFNLSLKRRRTEEETNGNGNQQST